MRIEGFGLAKRFGRVEALRGIDFTIPGGKVGLFGPNASGKSTLIRIILGLLRCEGELRLDGPAKCRHELSSRIVYVPQIAPKFGAFVGEVIRATARVREMSPDAVTQCGAEVGIDLAEVERQAFRDLSGGAKQKTLISLALASRALLYVLDEPTASLDTQSRRDLFRLLTSRTRDSTLLLCSHRLEEIRTLVDQVMVLEEGRLSYFGPTEAYLDHMTLSTIDVLIRNGVGDEILVRLGFQRGVAGWWSRTATRMEKLDLLSTLSHDMEGQVLNLLVRDADAVQLRGGGDGDIQNPD